MLLLLSISIRCAPSAPPCPATSRASIEVEQIAVFTFPATAIVAGDGFDGRPLPVYSYRLIYPDGSIIVDTALSQAIGGSELDELRCRSLRSHAVCDVSGEADRDHSRAHGSHRRADGPQRPRERAAQGTTHRRASVGSAAKPASEVPGRRARWIPTARVRAVSRDRAGRRADQVPGSHTGQPDGVRADGEWRRAAADRRCRLALPQHRAVSASAPAS